MKKIWRYTPMSGFTNKNAGFSMWCFAEYQGKEYFIKQFLSPKYPADDNISSPEKIARKKRECADFERRKTEMYSTLTKYSDGNDVRIVEFFRVASRYYIATEKIDSLPWTVETISSLEENEKRRICALIAHAVASLHKGHLVHSDIKHDNILYTYSEEKRVIPKIIDFDGGFLEENPPASEDEVTGDLNYFSPEVCARTYGEDRKLTCKLDIFALGVLFYQYFSGELPEYNHEEYACPGDAVLRGSELQLNENLPDDILELVKEMLSRDPAERPTANGIMNRLLKRPEETHTGESSSESGSTDELYSYSINASDDDVTSGFAICPKCGNRQDAKMKFCFQCGNQIRDTADSNHTVPKKVNEFFYMPTNLN